MASSNDDFLVRNPEVEKQLKEWGRKVKDSLPENYGFMLMIFSYGEGGDLFYMSSAERESVLETMEEFIKKERSKK